MGLTGVLTYRESTLVEVPISEEQVFSKKASFLFLLTSTIIRVNIYTAVNYTGLLNQYQ